MRSTAGGTPRSPGRTWSLPEKIGKYEVVRKIGSGGFGSVYEARDPFIKRIVAVKTCEIDAPEMQSRFFQEAELGGRLQHRNVTTVHDFGIEKGVPYMVEEFLDGEDLDRLIAGSPELPLIEKLQILIGIAYGLEYTHNAGILHQDIKPANVRVLADGTVKLMDFGIARSLQTDTNLVGRAAGTFAYLAPELISGGAVDRRTDVFSFGVLAYELLAGRRPFAAATQKQLLDRIVQGAPVPLEEAAAEVPPALAAIVQRAMKKNPIERYPAIEPMREDLIAVYRSLFGRDTSAQSRPRDASGGTMMAPRPDPPRGPEKGLDTQELSSQRALPEPSFEPLGRASGSEPMPRGRRLRIGLVLSFALALLLGGFLIVVTGRRVPPTPPRQAPSARRIVVPSSPREAPATHPIRSEPPLAKSSSETTTARRAPDAGRPADQAQALRDVQPPPSETVHSRRVDARASRYAKAANEPGLSEETRAATSLAGAWASYQVGATESARGLLRLAFSWRADLPADPTQYSAGFARLAEQVRSER